MASTSNQANEDEESGLLVNELRPKVKSLPPARKVTQVARKIRQLMIQLVPLQVKESHITNPKSRIITDGVLKLVESAAHDEPGCVVFCCVYVANYFHRLCSKDLSDADVHVLRAIACEVIAKRLIENQQDEEFLYSELLLRRYSIINRGQTSDPKSTVEVGLVHRISNAH